jgi:hypothetical protein
VCASAAWEGPESIPVADAWVSCVVTEESCFKIISPGEEKLVKESPVINQTFCL